MPQSRTPAVSSPDGILDAVQQGERQRRRRSLTRVLSWLTPAVAGGLLVAALVIRFTGIPVAAFWIVLAPVAAAVACFAWIAVRVPVVTDAGAARLDADANLGGELRSAHWFASHPEPDAWTSYHLAGAAKLAGDVSWPAVYPPVPAARAWAGSAVLLLAAIAVASTAAWPLRYGSGAGGVQRASGTGSASTEPAVPADLQKKIDELLRLVAKGELPMDTARAQIGDLRDALANIDPKLQEAVAKAAQGQPQKPGSTDRKMADPELEELASRAETAAGDTALPEDMKWSLQDLAAKLAKASRASAAPGNQADPQAKDGRPSDGQPPSGSAAPAASAEMMRMTTAEAETNQMMASRASPAGGDPSGRGGDAGRKGRAGEPLDLSGVLRKEAIEAAADSAGANVLAEMRRKSEQSHSTLQFSHVAPLANYDKSHASAPPPTPDALRPLVQQYFIRR